MQRFLLGAGLLGLALCARPAAAQTVPAGLWQGQIGARRVVLTLKPDSAFVGLPEDGSPRELLRGPRFVGDSLLATRPPLVLRGRFSPDRRTLTATLAAYGNKPLPVVLGRVAAVQPLHLPQDPVLPLPYRAEDVAFASDSGRVRLAGTLTHPAGSRRGPAVVLLSGTGPQGRDYTIGMAGHQPFRVLADYLTRRGIAVLRFDDRGVGKSSGNYALATTADFAHDAEAAVRYLRTRPDIDPRQVGVIGHSEGGAAAFMAAAADPDIAFVVSLAGLLSPGLQALQWQNQSLVDNSALVPRAKQRANEINGLMFQAAYANAAAPDLADKLRTVFQQWFAQDQARQLADHAPDDHFRFPSEGYIRQATSPWYRYHIRFDPAPYLAKVRVPVLALNGDRDRLVDYHALPAAAAQLRKAGNRDVTIKVMPGDSHLLQPCQTCEGSEATSLATTLDPAVLQTVGDWVQQHTKTKK